MDFGDLQGFAVVARLGSFSRAAAHLRIAQSALSRRVKRLEYQFGTKLLERHSRGAISTKAGTMLLGAVESLDRDLKQIQQDILSLKDSLVGEVTLSLPLGVTQFLTTAIIQFYRHRCPDVKLRILEAKSADNYDAVISGNVDVAVVYNPEPRAELTTLPLYDDQLLLVGPADPAADVASIQDMKSFPGKLLSTLPLILPNRGFQIRVTAEKIAERFDSVLHVPIEVDGLSSRKTLVRSGLGYTLLANSAVQQELAAGILTAVPLVEPQVEFMVGLIYRTDRRHSRVLQDLTEALGTIIQDMPRVGFWHPVENVDAGVANERWRCLFSQWPSRPEPARQA